MTVVLRPNSTGELVLELHQRAGSTEALLRCDHSMFDALNREWTQLHEALSSLNVRLLPLEPGSSATSNGQSALADPRFADSSFHPGSNHHQPGQFLDQRSERKTESWPEFNQGPASDTKPGPPPFEQRRSRLDRWETWA
jgi:hypothetical protein